MLSNIWHNVFFDPIYNALVYLITVVPGGDVGLAIVALTILVKFILIPLSLKAAYTQHAMRRIEPELTKLKEKYKKNREKLARATMALYKEAKINPFASILLIFIQLPIIIALYLSVFRGGGVPFPDINTDILYSFIIAPDALNMMFLGIVDIGGRSLVLAFLAGGTQFIHGLLSLPKPKPKSGSGPNLKEDLMRSMNINMRYMMPILIFFVAYTISASIALYFFVSNIMSIAQEFIVRSKIPDRHNTQNNDTNIQGEAKKENKKEVKEKVEEETKN